ncbi:MAG: LacI family transcriptional regulator [Opitutaceae bacterium]|jgi:LacI family transcriptional regulator|nr:LacI family transcriptional regulator [Opitutaceae bacterium]
MPQTHVTMQDVAARAGVHQTTVSLALRNQPRIPAATRERIQAAARELGYTPNPLVSALIATRQRRTRTRQAVIAYVSADDEAHGGRRGVYQDLFDGASDRAEELGYGLEHFWLGDPKLTRARFNQITFTRNIHGLILGPLFMQRPTLDVDWARFSVVAYGYGIAEPHVHRVYPDFYHGMVEALRRCRAAGYQRVGTVLEEKTDVKADHLWLSACLSEQHLHKGHARIPPLLLPRWDEHAFAGWRRRHRPQVIIGLNSMLYLIRDWTRTPAGRAAADMRLVMLNLTTAALPAGETGVLIDRGRVGAACVDQLVGMMHRNEKGVPEKALHLIVENGWVDGEGFLPK